MAYGEKFARPIAVGLFAMALSAVLVCVFAITGLTSPPPIPEATAVVRALATPAFLAAGALRLARWHITGEYHCGLRGVALLLMGGVCLPSVALARSLSALGEGLTVATCVRALSVGAILFLMTVAIAGDAPHRAALRHKAGLITATAAAVSVLLLVGRDRLPLEASPQALLTRGVATALAIAWLTLAAVAVAKARRTDWAKPAAPLLAAMGLAEICRIPEQPLTTLVAAAITAAVGFLVAASALVDLVRAAQDEHAATEDLTLELAVVRSAISDRDIWRADLTHDARGTLAGIRAAMQTLERHADELDPATAERLRRATLAELTHLEHMLECRRTDEDFFDVADVVRSVTDVRRAAGLRVDVTSSPARLRGVSGDLATVLQNLLVNAHVHAPGAGVRVDVRLDGPVARIVVADDGPGIPATAAVAAFGRGSRGPSSNGSGLGLSIARALTRRHGGELELVPSTRGSTFVISWPLAEHVGAASLRLEAAAS
jgi:signal transduction histidine kinase